MAWHTFPRLFAVAEVFLIGIQQVALDLGIVASATKLTGLEYLDILNPVSDATTDL